MDRADPSETRTHTREDHNARGYPWRTSYFYFGGGPVQRNLDACPQTARILRRLPTNKNHVCFSAIEPGGVLRPHTGPTNTSLTAHLGLANCEAASIWVAGAGAEVSR